VTIHSGHPFVPADDAKAALRRLRGRLVSPVTVVATGEGHGRVGLTVSSVLLVDGDPGRVIATIDPDSSLGEAVDAGVRAAVSVLAPGDEYLADVFAGLAPAPGGMFTIGTWVQTPWGPRLDGRSWCGLTVDDVRSLGWSVEVLGSVGHVEIHDPAGLSHLRGRYRRID